MATHDNPHAVPTHFVAALDDWLDANVSEVYKAEPLGQHWARIAKIGEEYGETVSAFIGYTGQNPRKSFYASMADVLDELCDVAITAVLAMQHFTKDEQRTYQLMRERWDYRLKAAGL